MHTHAQDCLQSTQKEGLWCCFTLSGHCSSSESVYVHMYLVRLLGTDINQVSRYTEQPWTATFFLSCFPCCSSVYCIVKKIDMDIVSLLKHKIQHALLVTSLISWLLEGSISWNKLLITIASFTPKKRYKQGSKFILPTMFVCFVCFFFKEQPSSISSNAMQFTCFAQYWEVKPTSLNSLANEPGVEIFLKGFDLKQLNITATQHVQRSCICTVQK